MNRRFLLAGLVPFGLAACAFVVAGCGMGGIRRPAFATVSSVGDPHYPFRIVLKATEFGRFNIRRLSYDPFEYPYTLYIFVSRRFGVLREGDYLVTDLDAPGRGFPSRGEVILEDERLVVNLRIGRYIEYTDQVAPEFERFKLNGTYKLVDEAHAAKPRKE